MNYLDPTYLRYIYDGLIKGSVHSENESELPDGLIGLYEEAFEEHLPVMERQQLLQRFALFALLKKEVSAAFVAEVLRESEQEISEFINTYASWFNSPEPGKFQLYHERLKVYVLQKFSEKEIQVVHENLITRLEFSIEEQKADEFEIYALEFLSEHLLVEAFGDESKGKKLLDFTKNETLWDRQIRISNKFDWSRKGLHHAALWTSKYDQEENIDCYLDLVQLHNKEQNDAENIVRLVANNEIDLALERITAFGGPSKEEKERQFILFMLCLMELTLLESKTQPWRKEAIEKLLKHLEEEIPVDHSLVNWGEFFSSYLCMNIIIELNKIEFNCNYIFDLTRSMDFNEILEKETNLLESEKIIKEFLFILNKSNNQFNDENYFDLAFFYIRLNKFRDSFKIINKVENHYLKDKYKEKVCDYLLQHNKTKYLRLLFSNSEFKDDEIYFKICKYYLKNQEFEKFEFYLSKIDSIDYSIFLLIKSIQFYREHNKIQRIQKIKEKIKEELFGCFKDEKIDNYSRLLFDIFNTKIKNKDNKVTIKNIKLLFENYIQSNEDIEGVSLNESNNETIFHLIVLLYKFDLISIADTLFEAFILKGNFDDISSKETIIFRKVINSYLFKSHSKDNNEIIYILKRRLNKSLIEVIIEEEISYLLSNNLFLNAVELSKSIENKDSIIKKINTYFANNNSFIKINEFLVKTLAFKLQVEKGQKEFVVYEYLENYIRLSIQKINFVSLHKLLDSKKNVGYNIDDFFLKNFLLNNLKIQVTNSLKEQLINTTCSNISDSFSLSNQYIFKKFKTQFDYFNMLYKDLNLYEEIENLILEEFVKYQISNLKDINPIIKLIEDKRELNLINLYDILSKILKNHEVKIAEVFSSIFLPENTESIFLIYITHLKQSNITYANKKLEDLKNKCFKEFKFINYLEALVYIGNFNEISYLFHSGISLENQINITNDLLNIYDKKSSNQLFKIINDNIIFYLSIDFKVFDHKSLLKIELILVKLTRKFSLNNNELVLSFFDFVYNLLGKNIPERIFKNHLLALIRRFNSSFLNNNLIIISKYIDDRTLITKILLKLTHEIEFYKINLSIPKLEKFQIDLIKLESLKNLKIQSGIRNDYLFNNKHEYKNITILILKYSLFNIFFNQYYSQEKLQKFNRVLNLQWAIDLKNELDQLPN